LFLYFIKESVQFGNKSISRIKGGWIRASFKFEWRILQHWTFDEKSFIVMITKRNRYANEVQMSKFQCKAYSIQFRIKIKFTGLSFYNCKCWTNWCWEDIGLKKKMWRKKKKKENRNIIAIIIITIIIITPLTCRNHRKPKRLLKKRNKS